MEERRRLDEMQRQLKLEQNKVAESKLQEKQYLRGLKEKDVKEHISIRNKLTHQLINENKEFMKSIMEKNEKEIEQWRNYEVLKKNIVKEVLSNQIDEKKNISEIQRRARREEVS